MAEKKKQASIAAFFSPRAKSSEPPPPPPPPPAADAPPAKPQRKSRKAAVAAANDVSEEQPADLRSPASPSPAAPAVVEVANMSEPPSPNNGGGKRTIIGLFATPPPPKRTKTRDDAAADVQMEEKEADTTNEQLRAAAAEDSEEVISGDDDLVGGPHVMVSAPKTRKPSSRSRARKATKASPRAAGALSSDSTSATPKAKEKKQPARAAKEKAAEPAPVEEKAAPPPVVLDPLVKARVDTYQQKIDDLTQQCAHLLQAPSASDGVLQEIYGLAVDLGLELDEICRGGKLGKSTAELFSNLSREQKSEGKSDAVTEFSADLKGFVAKSVQGHSESLSSLSHQLLQTLEGLAQSGDDAVVVNAKVEARVLVMLEMEIKMLAQRTNYGVRPAKANLYEDTSADALWIWEVGNVEKYFADESQKTIKRMRKNRKRLGLQLKALARVVHLLHQAPVDEVKVSAEEAKVSKFVLAIESETQKAQDRERKELEKVQIAEQKKQHELEKERAKQEEKRKREEDTEAERALANKRKKSLVSYFRSIDSSSSSSGTAPGAAAGDSAARGESEGGIDVTNMSQADRRKAWHASAQNEIMARMDAVVAFLVGGEKASELAVSSALSGDAKSVQQVRAHVQGERKSGARVTAASGFWNSRRRRDPALGVMKLLQFHENYRPAYFGTFSTKSRVFRGGRRPLAQYAKFDYSVDSEEEWEEEEPGESLSDADSDLEESDDDLDYGDQWLAYEDEVDYIDGSEDDEETKDGDDGYLASPERKPKKRVPEQKKRAKVPGGRKKGVKPCKLEPQVVGPFLFEDASSSVEAAVQLSAYTGELLRQPLFESALMRKAREYEEEKERQQQQLELEQQQQQDKQPLSSVASAPATTASSQPQAVVASKQQPKSQQNKTPTKTPQKRKASVENLESPQKITQAAPAAASVKSGIAAWLKTPKPAAIVDLSGSASESDAATTTTTVGAVSGDDDAVVNLSNHGSDT